MRKTKMGLKKPAGILLFLLLTAALAVPSFADQNYSQQVFFDNSLSPGNYFYSDGKATAPSELKLVDGKLPIETSEFISGPNAIELQWQSMAAGGWEGELRLYQWRDRYVDFPGKTLFFWCYSKEGIRAQDLPSMALRDLDGGFTRPLSIAAYTHDLGPAKWTRVRIPLAAFSTASLHSFAPRRLAVVAFVQGAADQAPHTLFIDDIRVEDADSPAQHAPATPRGVQAKGYERHIDVTWDPVDDPGLAQYVIYRSLKKEGEARKKEGRPAHSAPLGCSGRASIDSATSSAILTQLHRIESPRGLLLCTNRRLRQR